MGKVYRSTAEWIRRRGEVGDHERAELTAAKCFQWISCWELIRRGGWFTTSEIADGLSAHRRSVRRLMHRFHAAGLVEIEEVGRTGYEMRIRRVR